MGANPICASKQWYNLYVSQKGRYYQVNESFFLEWSATMAYVLGFWFADGYMRHDKSYRIVFTSADKQILVSIKEALSSSHLIKKISTQKSGSTIWYFTVFSKALYMSLQALGGVRAKSRIIVFPRVPSQYLADFIRGYFDGDGSVFFVSYKRSKDGKRTKELRSNFTSGSCDFLENLMQVLHKKICLSTKKLGTCDSGRTFKLGYGTKDTDALLHYMYYAKFPIGLKRKAKYIYRVPKYQKHFHAQVA